VANSWQGSVRYKTEEKGNDIEYKTDERESYEVALKLVNQTNK
jgi:hypothetical protein